MRSRKGQAGCTCVCLHSLAGIIYTYLVLWSVNLAFLNCHFCLQTQQRGQQAIVLFPPRLQVTSPRQGWWQVVEECHTVSKGANPSSHRAETFSLWWHIDVNLQVGASKGRLNSSFGRHWISNQRNPLAFSQRKVSLGLILSGMQKRLHDWATVLQPEFVKMMVETESEVSPHNCGNLQNTLLMFFSSAMHLLRTI